MRAVFLLLLLCLPGNSVIASICTVCDETAPAHSQVVDDRDQSPALIPLASDTNDGCCLFCQGCVGCGGGCSHAVGPLNSIPAVLRSHPVDCPVGAITDSHLQRLPFDLLRPPATA